MRNDLRNLFLKLKPGIISRLTNGNLHSLLAELDMHILDEDRDLIKCKLKNDGPTWAAESLLTCIESLDEVSLTRFLDYLRKTPSTKDLYLKIHREFKANGFDFILPSNQVDDNNAAANTSHQENDVKSTEIARRIIKEQGPMTRRSLSEGDLHDCLALFQTELDQSDIERAKATLQNAGKTLAVDTLLECLQKTGMRTIKKFILFLSKNKLELFEEFKKKFDQHGLLDMLPADEKAHDDTPLVTLDKSDIKELSAQPSYTPEYVQNLKIANRDLMIENNKLKARRDVDSENDDWEDMHVDDDDGDDDSDDYNDLGDDDYDGDYDNNDGDEDAGFEVDDLNDGNDDGDCDVFGDDDYDGDYDNNDGDEDAGFEVDDFDDHDDYDNDVSDNNENLSSDEDDLEEDPFW